MEKLHDDKVAVVTGGAKGIGYAIVEGLIDEGAKVAIIDFMEEDLKNALKTLTEKYGEGKVVGLVGDVSNEDKMRETFGEIYDKFGKINYLVNNAGISGPVKSISDYTIDEYRKVLDVDLFGTFMCTKFALEYMKDNDGNIVNIASVVGLVGSTNSAGYVTAKHGVVGLTKASALDLVERGIRVNAVAPGAIRTEMVEQAAITIANGDRDAGIQMIVGRNPMGRLGEPEEISGIVNFLLSNKSEYLNGQTIRVDGIQTLTF